jgi:hypothetical protein
MKIFNFISTKIRDMLKMNTYALQIVSNSKRLIKCYKITENDPVRTFIPNDRTQIIINNTTLYNNVTQFYNENLLNAEFDFDIENKKITFKLKE